MVNKKFTNNQVDLIKGTGILILATIILSMAIGFSYELIALLTKKTASQSGDLFVRSVVGILQGAFLGYVAGLIIGSIAAAFTPIGNSGIMSINLSGLNKAIVFTLCLLICWLIGILAYAIKVGGNYFSG